MKSITIMMMSLVLMMISITGFAVKRYGEIYCHKTEFSCIKIKKGQTWQSLWPDDYDRQVVMRLNRMNIPLRPGMRIAVPNNLPYVDLADIAPFPQYIEPQQKKIIVVDPTVLAWGAYDKEGYLVHWGPMSGGKSYCRDIGKRCRTVTGKFQVFRKMGAECKSTKFPVGEGGAPMPYCMFFHRGYALHASDVVPGYHASHGCVRIFEEDAEWLNTEFIDLPQYRKRGTTVIIQPYL